ncbi:MAG: hypothetical protein NTV51_07265 [Verrucomicrobia bacterium]|nr:hypothetical protein [Verrucomicrobiota bacterium]
MIPPPTTAALIAKEPSLSPFLLDPPPANSALPPEPPAAPAPAPAAVAPAAAEPAKFKLKPKGAPPAPGAIAAPPPPPPPVTAPKFPPPPGLAKSAPPPPPPPVSGLPPPPPPPGVEGAPKLPPPFPVVAAPSTGKTTPPIPHIAAASEAPEEEQRPVLPRKPDKARSFKTVVAIGGVAAVLVLGAGGYFAWTMFLSSPPPPPPVVARPKPAAPAAGPAAAPAAPGASSIANKAAAPLTPSDTLNNLAHAPVNAVNKAKTAVEARRPGDQAAAEVIGAGQDSPDKRPGAAAPGADAAKGPAAKANVSASASLSPGVSATTSDVDAVAEASPAFRTFVANAKITGVIGGNPPRMILNGRLARGGDLVDPGLGVTFDGIDADRKLLLFKDKSGAIVTRKF